MITLNYKEYNELRSASQSTIDCYRIDLSTVTDAIASAVQFCLNKSVSETFVIEDGCIIAHIVKVGEDVSVWSTVCLDHIDLKYGCYEITKIAA